MFATRVVAATGVIVMAGALVMGFLSGDFGAEGSDILALAWGRVTLVDLYVGVMVFSAFVVWRERHAGIVTAWIVSFIVLGNLATAVYLLNASLRAATVEELLSPVR